MTTIVKDGLKQSSDIIVCVLVFYKQFGLNGQCIHVLVSRLGKPA